MEEEMFTSRLPTRVQGIVTLQPYMYNADVTVVVDLVGAYAAGLRFYLTPSLAVLCGAVIPPEFIILITENRTGAVRLSRKNIDDEDEPGTFRY